MKIGCHLSIANGFYKAGLQALELGADSFQFFTRNPRGGKAKALDYEDLDKLSLLMREHKFGSLFAHGSYTMNLCSNKEATRTYAKRLLADDMKRLEAIPNALYVFHPGSHVKQGTEVAIEQIAAALNEVLTEETSVTLCLETMSGKGTEVGRSFEELKQIMDRVVHSQHLGVCIDTCHLYSAGYDIIEDLDGVLEHFDKVIGLDKLRAIHLNDSKMPFASHKDRHEKIGEGTLGKKGIIRLLQHPKLQGIPVNLETPNELSGYKQEIEMIRNAVNCD